MKCFCVLILLLYSFGTVRAQSSKQYSLESAVKRLHQAMLEGDGRQLEELIHDSLTYGHSNGIIEGKESFVKNLVTGVSDFITLDVSDQVIAKLQKAAWVRFHLMAEIIDKGNRMNVTLRVLYVWVRENNQWKLLARQAVKQNPG